MASHSLWMESAAAALAKQNSEETLQVTILLKLLPVNTKY